MPGEGGVRENQNFQIAGIWYDLFGLSVALLAVAGKL